MFCHLGTSEKVTKKNGLLHILVGTLAGAVMVTTIGVASIFIVKYLKPKMTPTLTSTLTPLQQMTSTLTPLQMTPTVKPLQQMTPTVKPLQQMTPTLTTLQMTSTLTPLQHNAQQRIQQSGMNKSV